jgi:hypothetical protein
MGPLLVLLGIGVAVIGAPIMLVIEYRRQLSMVAETDRGMPVAQLTGALAEIARSGAYARRHHLALRAGVFRRLVPAWAAGLAMILLGVLVT